MTLEIGTYYARTNPMQDNPGQQVNRIFNDLCTKAGVSCLIGMNPSDFTRFYVLKNVGKKLVRIEYDSRIMFLEPGEHIQINIIHDLRGNEICIPQVDALNNGL